jgi:uncharacterized protein
MRTHRLVRWSVWLLVAYLAASIAIGLALAETGLRPPRTMHTSSQAQEAAATASLAGRPLETVTTRAADGVSLRGWFFATPSPNAATVLVTHGVSGNRGHSVALARVFASQGYAVLAPDARGHGESAGMASFGARERADIHAWVDFVLARRPRTCVVGVGSSMGAAQLLQAIPGEPRLCGIVAESSFSTFREVAYDRVGQRFGVGPWLGRTILRPAIAAAFVYVDLRYGADLADASPAAAVRATRLPILLIHGEADVNIPVRHARAILEASRSIRFWLVPNAGHEGAWPAAPAEFERRVLEFVREVSVPR